MQSLSRTLRTAALVGALFLATAAPSLAQGNAPPIPGSELGNAEVQELSRQILPLPTLERNSVLARLVDRDNTDVVPALIQSLRFLGQDPWSVVDALKILTGEDHGKRWHDWVLWQEGRPDITPFEGFDEYKSWVYVHIDPNLAAFPYADIAHTIRLEEITWGGVTKDGIPALVNPKLVPPAEADYITPDELVFGIEINGDTRLAPKDYVFALRMGDAEKAWALSIFEDTPVLNDTIAGRAVVLIGDPESRTVRAYETGGNEFMAHGSATETLVAGSNDWRITEAELVSAGGETLARLPGHIAYWFAWHNFRPRAETRFE